MITTTSPSKMALISPPLKSYPIRQCGVGLIEVLVAVLILALGLLGMAGLQANTLKASQSSHSRAQATMLSYYILDAMRADRAGAMAGNYNTGTSAASPITAICSVAAITGATLQDNTRKHWIGSLKTNLIDQNTTCGAVYCDNLGECTIEITWDDSVAGGLGSQTFTTRSRL